jgi:hypothetical protein
VLRGHTNTVDRSPGFIEANLLWSEDSTHHEIQRTNRRETGLVVDRAIRLTILSNIDLVREDVSKTYVHNFFLVKYIDKLPTEIANSCP